MSQTSVTTLPANATDKGLLSPGGITVAGLVCNIALSGLKIVGGLIFRSQTLLADGLHSGSDLVSDVAVLAGLRVSKRPADMSHPYGHRRVETLVTMFIGLMLVAAAVYVGMTAATKLHEGESVAYGWVPFALAMVSVTIKEILYHLTRRVGKRSGNTSLLANAWHHRSDAFSSLAAGAGMFGVALGGGGWAFLDGVTALALAGLLVAMGLKMTTQAAQELIDRAPAQQVIDGIGEIVRGTAGVKGYHAIRMRHLGGELEMDIHIQVPPSLSVAEGHDIATEVRRQIRKANPNITTVIVHVEPVETHA